VNHILEGLNEQQQKAVLTAKGPVLIFAGAGSGKTKCLTHRIAHLIATGVPPERILAVTFTNKAASEMKERVGTLLSAASNGQKPRTPYAMNRMPWIGTFHSFCVFILREEAPKIGFTKYFSIFDDDDSISLIKELLKEMNISSKQFPAAMMRNAISGLKNELISPDTYDGKNSPDPFPKTLWRLYERYQKGLADANAFDFDDLIMKTVLLFREHPATLLRWQEQFQYIHIDEFQDTNASQYELSRLLAGLHKNIFVIGDDAQSIYSWRGADFRNILNFEKDWPGATTILLEENYRSTQPILNAANHVIAHNTRQKKKWLSTQKAGGENPHAVIVPNERHEAEYIAEHIHERAKRGEELSQFVVLYRTNAQSRAIEEQLIERGLPYKIVGGVKFYERKEVRDLLGYLRLSVNPQDLASIKRIINVPARGIGKMTLLKYMSHPVTETGARDTAHMSISERRRVEQFERVVRDMREASLQKIPSRLIEFLINRINYEQYLEDSMMDAENRIENIKEFAGLAKKYDELPLPAGLVKLLEDVALLADADAVDERAGAVHLMTVHAAKGLEFPVVFIAGLEEGVFPHSKALFDQSALEEERRLFYVGITRAKELLYLLCAHRRLLWGETSINPPSRFLKEIPDEFLQHEDYVGEYGNSYADEKSSDENENILIE